MNVGTGLVDLMVVVTGSCLVLVDDTGTGLLMVGILEVIPGTAGLIFDVFIQEAATLCYRACWWVER